MARHPRSIVLVVVVVVSGVTVVVSTLLPWASYENVSVGTTTRFGSGSGGFLLAALAVVSVAAASLGFVRRSAILLNAGIAAAVASLVCAVVLSLAAIVAANDANVAGGRTARSWGAFVGIGGSLGLLIGCSMLRSAASAVERPTVATP